MLLGGSGFPGARRRPAGRWIQIPEEAEKLSAVGGFVWSKRLKDTALSSPDRRWRDSTDNPNLVKSATKQWRGSVDHELRSGNLEQ